MFKYLIFVTIVVPLITSVGCANNRHTVLSVTAEASAFEQAPFYQAGGTARISYRLESMPHSNGTP